MSTSSDSVETTGTTVDEAVEKALEELEEARENVEVTVLDESPQEARVRVTVRESYAVKARQVVAAGARAHDRPETTHVCVVDDAGNAVSLTHTLGSASGVVTPGLGFGYNDYMNCFDPRPGQPNSVQPGKTRVTMMTPTLVFDRGRLRACVGAPGGTKIVTAILQVLVNVIDHKMSPVEAVSAPRIDFQGDVVQTEARIPLAVTRRLETLGYAVNRRTLNYDSYFARPQVIAAGADGHFRGASDPRKDGGTALDTMTT